jgi:hypothetical protein
MNTMNFDLKNIDTFDNFNKLHVSKKKNVLSLFNLNRYRFVLDEMKKIYELLEDKKLIQERISKVFEEGCLNFHIINSNYSCNLYIGSSYYLYFNVEEKKYYLYVLKKSLSNLEEFKGQFKLCDDLIWRKIE